MAGLMSRLSLEDFARAAAAADGRVVPTLPKTLDPKLGREIVQILVSDMRKRFTTGTTPDGQRWKPLKYGRPRGGSKPLMDTGRLMASITGRADATGVSVGTAAPGAALQNFGGIVRPVKGKYLAIPLTKEAQRAGSPRRVRGTPDMPLFARKVQGRFVGHFLLVKQVKVPARQFFGISKEAERAVGMAILDAAAINWVRG